MNITPISGTFGAEIEGIDVSKPIADGERDEIRAALDQFAFLSFPNQPLTDEQQVAFTGRFGQVLTVNLDAARGRMSNQQVAEVSNLDADGQPFKEGSQRKRIVDANLLWHTDGSYNPVPLRLTTLSARVLPPSPPDTEYADMRAAWDALPEGRQSQLESLSAYHSRGHSLRKTGGEVSKEELEALQAKQPLVRVNPRTGRKSLYLASHAYLIDGWPEEESEAFLNELTAFATQPQFVLSYAWRPYDLVMWDDLATMHRATSYTTTHKRELHWNAVVDAPDVA